MKKSTVEPSMARQQKCFAERVRLVRLQSGLNQGQFGLPLSVTGGAVSAWEKGDRFPSSETLVQLAAIYKVSLDWLCGLDTDYDPMERARGFLAERLLAVMHEYNGFSRMLEETETRQFIHTLVDKDRPPEILFADGLPSREEVVEKTRSILTSEEGQISL